MSLRSIATAGYSEYWDATDDTDDTDDTAAREHDTRARCIAWALATMDVTAGRHTGVVDLANYPAHARWLIALGPDGLTDLLAAACAVLRADGAGADHAVAA